jgi:hypothetical protein
MYSGYQLREILEPTERCVRLRAYKNGQYEDLYHEHIPVHRLGDDACVEMMKALVVRFSGFSSEYIVQNYKNKRGGQPRRANEFQFHTEYPEPGVIRHYCGTNVQTWSDRVISREKFRQS